MHYLVFLAKFRGSCSSLSFRYIKGFKRIHYYPFGLTMAGISSKAAGTIQNKEKTFQGQRFDDDLGLNWIQFKWRNHDVQIGRFIEIDPLADKYVYNSTYAFSENKVTNHVELEGLEACESAALRNEKRLFNGEQTEAEYSQNIKAQAIGGVVAGGIVFSLMFPAISAPIIAADLFGVPSPTAPTSVVGTVSSEVKTLSNIEKNAATGKDFEQKVVANLTQNGNTNVAEQVTIKAKNGVNTRVDVVSRDANGKIVLTEAKGSATAPLTKNQKIAHPSIEQSGGVVVGEGKPGFPGGTTIPPTKVDVVRPSNFWDYKF
jgi:RHS repeat-associated protein